MWRPKSVSFGCRKFKIQYCDTFDDRIGLGNRGVILYDRGLILVYTDDCGEEIPDDTVQEAVAHELIHGWLFHTGRDDLAEDETFVQSLAGSVAQTLRTLK